MVGWGKALQGRNFFYENIERGGTRQDGSQSNRVKDFPS